MEEIVGEDTSIVFITTPGQVGINYFTNFPHFLHENETAWRTIHTKPSAIQILFQCFTLPMSPAGKMEPLLFRDLNPPSFRAMSKVYQGLLRLCLQNSQ